MKRQKEETACPKPYELLNLLQPNQICGEVIVSQGVVWNIPTAISKVKNKM